MDTIKIPVTAMTLAKLATRAAERQTTTTALAADVLSKSAVSGSKKSRKPSTRRVAV